MAVIAGTRIPVARIIHLLKEGYTVEAVQEDYPHVSVKKIEGALDELIETLAKEKDAPLP